MEHKKSNYAAYSSFAKSDGFSTPTNITDLIKRNREEEKRKKIKNIYTVIGFVGTILLLGTFIYL